MHLIIRAVVCTRVVNGHYRELVLLRTPSRPRLMTPIKGLGDDGAVLQVAEQESHGGNADRDDVWTPVVLVQGLHSARLSTFLAELLSNHCSGTTSLRFRAPLK